MDNLGKLLLVVGAGIMLLGIVVLLLGGRLGWVGNLPGDIKIERPGFSFYMPITTMLLLSAALSALLWAIRQITPR
jgi:hypothetical protein